MTLKKPFLSISNFIIFQSLIFVSGITYAQQPYVYNDAKPSKSFWQKINDGELKNYQNLAGSHGTKDCYDYSSLNQTLEEFQDTPRAALRQEISIIGTDGFRPVKDHETSFSEPVGLMYGEFEDGSAYFATGFLAGSDKTIVTAKHTIFNEKGERRSFRALYFYPDPSNPKVRYQVRLDLISDKHYVGGTGPFKNYGIESSSDTVALILDKATGLQPASLEAFSQKDAEQLLTSATKRRSQNERDFSDSSFAVVGFPKKYGIKQKMISNSCGPRRSSLLSSETRSLGSRNYAIAIDCDTDLRSSGGPIFGLSEDKKSLVVKMVVSSHAFIQTTKNGEPSPNVNYNGASRFNMATGISEEFIASVRAAVKDAGYTSVASLPGPEDKKD